MNNPFVVIIDDFGYRDVTIERKEFNYRTLHFYYNNCWFISLKEDTSFLDGTKLKRMEYGYYEAYLNDGERISIFVYEDSKGKDEYVLYEKTDELFSKDAVTLINPIVHRNSFSLLENIFYTNCDLVLVNNIKIKSSCVLKDGDRINIAGTVIVWFTGFVYMNSFMVENSLAVYKPVFNDFRYSLSPRHNIRPYIDMKMPVLTVSELEPFSFTYRKENISPRQFIPSLIMSMAMVMTTLFNCLNMQEYDSRKLLIYMIMPAGMVMSMVLWPLIWALYERKKEKRLKNKAISEYLDYLDNFNIRLKEDINSYLEDIKPHIHKDTDALFYIDHNHESYLTLCLGNICLKNAQSLYSKDKRIQKLYDTTNELYERKIPFIINLNDKRKVNIIVKKEDIEQVFEGIITELAGKHNPNDMKIAIYSENDSLLNNIRFLPHLFLHTERLIYKDKESIKELDCIAHETKTVLICLGENVTEISNENVIQLSIITDKDMRNTADLNIEIIDNKGSVLETKQTFKYEKSDNKKNLRNIIRYADFRYDDNPDSFSGWSLDHADWKDHDNRLIAEFASNKDGLFSLDLHESSDGPHMLIGGMTGSGKSELIISMLLSLAMRYPPDYVKFIIVDYKGGGIAQSLCTDSKYIPHIYATADNLDGDNLERLLIALSQELRIRQKKFKELSEKINRPILNIDDYIEYEKMAHLIVLVDEFGELKRTNPELLEELVSYSRIGRSLGLHLILSTQKPSSSVDEEIISNTSIRLALKTADRKDSSDIIKTEEAMNIHSKGEFIVITAKGKTKARAFYSRNSGTEKHETILLDTNLKKLKSIKDETDETSDLEKILKSIKRNKSEREVLDYRLPKEKTVEELKKEYNVNEEGIILGEADDYLNATKRILVHSLNENALIYSSRVNELNGILNSLNNKNIIVISNRKIKGLSDSITYDDEDTIEYLFERLKRNSERKYLVIEDISCFLSYRDDYITHIIDLIQRSEAIDLILLFITRSLQLPYRLVAAFEKRYIIKVKDKSAVNEFFMVRNRYKGNSFFYQDEPVSYVPAKIPGLNLSFKNEYFIETIPEIINKEKGLIGIDYRLRKKLYVPLDKKILITSDDKGILNSIEPFYGEQFVIKEYSRNMNTSTYNGIIYLGDIRRQDLFFVNPGFILKDNCAVYYDGKTARNIVMVNHE